MKELAVKVLYCLQMMRLSRWLTSLIEDDYKKRIIARNIFVYLDAFLKRAPELNNQIGKLGASVSAVKAVKEQLKQLTKDYDDFYSTIRDKLAAHRKDIPLIERIEAWNEIDKTTVALFIDEASSIYNSLAKLNSTVPPFSESKDLDNNQIKTQLEHKLKPDKKDGVVIGADNLAMTRPNTVSFIPASELQERGYQIISILDTLDFCFTLYSDTASLKDTERLIKSLIILDVFSLFDNLYPSPSGDIRYRVKSFLEIGQESGIKGYSILKYAHDKRDIATENKLREVRNKIAAHVAPDQDFDDLLANLDSVDMAKLSKIFISAYQAFEDSCKEDPRTFKFFIGLRYITRPITLTRVKSLVGNNYAKPY